MKDDVKGSTGVLGNQKDSENWIVIEKKKGKKWPDEENIKKMENSLQMLGLKAKGGVVG